MYPMGNLVRWEALGLALVCRGCFPETPQVQEGVAMGRVGRTRYDR